MTIIDQFHERLKRQRAREQAAQDYCASRGQRMQIREVWCWECGERAYRRPQGVAGVVDGGLKIRVYGECTSDWCGQTCQHKPMLMAVDRDRVLRAAIEYERAGHNLSSAHDL